MSRLVLVRHARPKKVAGVLPPAWHLAEQSHSDARDLSSVLRSGSSPLVLASSEPKAIETAEALGLGQAIPSSAFDEVSKPWFDDPSDHNDAVALYLAGEALDGWEPLESAVSRFDNGLDSNQFSGDIIVVSHGTVMSAWIGWKQITDEPFKFWSALTMPDAWEVDLVELTIRRLAGSGHRE